MPALVCTRRHCSRRCYWRAMERNAHLGVSVDLGPSILYLNSLKMLRARESSPGSARAFCLPAEAALIIEEYGYSLFA